MATCPCGSDSCTQKEHALVPGASDFLDFFHDNEFNRDRAFHGMVARGLGSNGERMNLRVSAKDPKGSYSSTAGINLDRDEVLKLRDFCDRFLSKAPSLEEQQFEAVREKLIAEYAP